MNIFILEDDLQRLQKIKSALPDEAVATHSLTAEYAINVLSNHKFDIMMLDHDLADEHYAVYNRTVFGQNQKVTVPFTGMVVVDWLIENKDKHHDALIIVHSLNAIARPIMIDKLSKSGFQAVDGAFCWEEGLLNDLLNDYR
jgi:DNA-binding NarL/FixJ family response regulator